MKTVLFLILLFAQSAFASLLVEPYLGLNWVNKYDIDGGKTYNTGPGIAYGGRLGLQKAGFQLGLDYMKTSSDMSNNDFKRNVTTTETGVFAGYRFPILIRVYAEYIFSASGDTKIKDSSEDLKRGTGGKVGVGFTLLPFLDLNLDYRKISFRDEDLGSFMASVSFPFDLF